MDSQAKAPKYTTRMVLDNQTRNELHTKLLDIARRTFPPGTESTPASNQISSAFHDIEEALGPHDVEIIVTALRYTDESFRKLMGGGPEALEYIECGLKSSNAEEQRGAVTVLGESQIPAGPVYLERALRNCTDSSARSSAVYYLCKTGKQSTEVISKAASDASPSVRLSTIGGIYQFIINLRPSTVLRDDWQPEGEHETRILGIVRQALHDEAAEIRRRALSLLSDIGQATFSEIEHACTDQDHMVREEAIKSLFAHRDLAKHESYLLIARALEDRRSNVSSAALDQLRRRGIYKVEVEQFADTIISELVVRPASKTHIDFNPDILSEVVGLAVAISPRVKNQALARLCDLAFTHSGDIQRRSAVLATKIDDNLFRTLINERARQNPLEARSIRQLLEGRLDTDSIANQISQSDPGDIQAIAASQIKLLDNYYRDVLSQANVSFRWAVIASVTGFILLAITLGYLMAVPTRDAVTVLTSVASVISQFIAGSLLFIYEQTRKQLAYFHQQLNLTERFLLANSVCESLEGESKQTARADLVNQIATLDTSHLSSRATTKTNP